MDLTGTSDALAAREAQVASAASDLSAVDLAGLDPLARTLVQRALTALRAPLSTGERRLSDDVGIRAQQAAEAHLEACYEAEFAMDEGDEDVQSPASGPFCSCETCVVREVLHAAWPVFEADAWLSHVTATTR